MTDTRTVVSSAAVELSPQALRELRQELGLLQSELARRADLSTKFISNLETGYRTRVSAPSFVRLCDALNIEPSRRWTLRKSSSIKQAA